MEKLDYKEKYEKALERAKNYREGHTLDVNPRIAMEYIFPELKETEDEKIRKELIKYLKERSHSGFNREVRICNDGIAWIEKQGTKKPAWSEEDEDVINHLLNICTGAKGYRQFAGCLHDDITKYQIWLKSLKDRMKGE